MVRLGHVTLSCKEPIRPGQYTGSQPRSRLAVVSSLREATVSDFIVAWYRMYCFSCSQRLKIKTSLMLYIQFFFQVINFVVDNTKKKKNHVTIHSGIFRIFLFFCQICAKVGRKVCIRARRPIRPALNSGFCSMKRLGILLLPPDGMLVHRKVTRGIMITGSHL